MANLIFCLPEEHPNQAGEKYSNNPKHKIDLCNPRKSWP